MHTCIPSHGLKRSWRSCPRQVNAGNKNTSSMHHPQRRNVTTSMVGLKKKKKQNKTKNQTTYAKISPQMVNPWDVARDRRRKSRMVKPRDIAGECIEWRMVNPRDIAGECRGRRRVVNPRDPAGECRKRRMVNPRDIVGECRGRMVNPRDIAEEHRGRRMVNPTDIAGEHRRRRKVHADWPTVTQRQQYEGTRGNPFSTTWHETKASPRHHRCSHNAGKQFTDQAFKLDTL